MTVYGGAEVSLHSFLTSALDEDEWSGLCPLERASAAHWIGVWVGPRARPNVLEKRKSLNIRLCTSIYIVCSITL